MIPPAHDGAFVLAMERVLRVYARPADPRFPVVCLDEAGKELQALLREPMPLAPGRPRRVDHEVTRHGMAALFIWVAPLLGIRHITVRRRRTKRDFVLVLRELVAAFPAAERITLILDNLNIHAAKALYEFLPPEEAAALDAKLEWVFTPKHGSWLNLAEPEWSVLRRQCLNRQIADVPQLEREVAAWEADHNAHPKPIVWRLTPEQARVRLPHVYPEPATLDDPDPACLS